MMFIPPEWHFELADEPVCRWNVCTWHKAAERQTGAVVNPCRNVPQRLLKKHYSEQMIVSYMCHSLRDPETAPKSNHFPPSPISVLFTRLPGWVSGFPLLASDGGKAGEIIFAAVWWDRVLALRHFVGQMTSDLWRAQVDTIILHLHCVPVILSSRSNSAENIASVKTLKGQLWSCRKAGFPSRAFRWEKEILSPVNQLSLFLCLHHLASHCIRSLSYLWWKPIPLAFKLLTSSVSLLS